LEPILAGFEAIYRSHYFSLMGYKLGLKQVDSPEAEALVLKTLEVLKETQVSYPQFFARLADQFNWGWREDGSLILENAELPGGDWQHWRQLYQQVLGQLPLEEMEMVGQRLRDANPHTILLRPLIETVWEAIAQEDNWQPFYQLLQALGSKGSETSSSCQD
jgi:uncharacterized protein YdiU (UPF0061 family)